MFGVKRPLRCVMRQATRDLLFAGYLDVPGKAQGREQPDEDKPWIVTHYALGFLLHRWVSYLPETRRITP
jgi:hypothetical protein